MKINKILLAIALGLSLTSCTDAEMASYGAYGDRATIICYSGGKAIHEDTSTGKVMQIDGDGITYKSSKTGKYVRAYADCIVTSL